VCDLKLPLVLQYLVLAFGLLPNVAFALVRDQRFGIECSSHLQGPMARKIFKEERVSLKTTFNH
jgi:hypothetical protein